jgi:hypothetical protein
MISSIPLEAFAASPSVQTALVLVLVSIAVRRYVGLPPRPKFPEAELDKSDWHGSFMKAKAKVCVRYGIRANWSLATR